MDLITTYLPVGLGQNIWLIITLAIWELFWKGLALWQSAKYHQKKWFIALLVINTAGILPIGYLLYHYYQMRRVHWVGHNL